jgi:hypothetical protein
VGQTPTLKLPYPDPGSQNTIPDDIRRLAEAIALEIAGTFPGMITPYRGSVPPPNWVLCDGANGTPDLRDKFVLGASAAHAVGSTGGTNAQTVAAVPHGHTASGVSTHGSGHTHGNVQPGVATDGVGDHDHGFGATSPQGGGPAKPRDAVQAEGGVQVYYKTNQASPTNSGGGDGNSVNKGPGTTDSPAHHHSVGGQSIDASGANPAHAHAASNTSANGGVASPAQVDNRPVFYSLIYVMKV